MADSTTMTVRLDQALVDRLEALARGTKRSRSFLAAEAIAAYVDSNDWQVERIAKAVAVADAGGPFAAQAEVEAWARRLGDKRPASRPKGRKL